MSDSAHALPDDDRPAPPAAPDAARPDWLVSSDQGAEDERRVHAEGAGPEGLRLTTSNDLSTAVPVERPKLPERPGPGAKPAEERSKGPKTWAAASSSVPRLKVTASQAASTSAHAPSIPHDAGPALRTAPALRAMPVARPLPPPPLDDDDTNAEAGFPDDTGPLGPVAAPPRMLDEPLWVVAIDALRSNRQAQILVALAVALPLVAWIFWPRGEPGVSLHALRQEPARWDGQLVRINGRVGEVFHVGAGWAFNLHQGRDTIVVFTRGSAPRSRDKISVAGSVSTGYLDGQPRQAIFAEPESR